MVIVGVPMVFCVLVQLWRTLSSRVHNAHHHHHHHPSTIGTIRKDLKMPPIYVMKLSQVPVLFVVLFSFVITSIIAFRFSFEVNQDSYYEIATEWYDCLIVNARNNITDPATNCEANTTMLVGDGRKKCGCGDQIPHMHELYPEIAVASIAINANGIFIAITFGLLHHISTFTRWLCRRVCRYLVRFVCGLYACVTSIICCCCNRRDRESEMMSAFLDQASTPERNNIMADSLMEGGSLNRHLLEEEIMRRHRRDGSSSSGLIMGGDLNSADDAYYHHRRRSRSSRRSKVNRNSRSSFGRSDNDIW